MVWEPFDNCQVRMVIHIFSAADLLIKVTETILLCAVAPRQQQKTFVGRKGSCVLNEGFSVTKATRGKITNWREAFF